MATDYSNSQEAQDRLALLEADRERLANNLATPWTLMTAAGAALAWFVADGVTANPGEGYTAGDGSLLAIAVLFIIGYFVQQQTGVQFRRLGGRAFAGALGVMVWTLAMFSVVLGLVSLGLRPWAVVPVLLTWMVGTYGCAHVFRALVGSVRRG